MGKAELYSFPEMGNGGRDERGKVDKLLAFHSSPSSASVAILLPPPFLPPTGPRYG